MLKITEAQKGLKVSLTVVVNSQKNKETNPQLF